MTPFQHAMATANVPTRSRIQRIACALMHHVNERPGPKALQSLYHRSFGQWWIHMCTRNLLRVEGLEHVRHLAPDRGVLLTANHRSFFDQYVLSSILLRNTDWVRELYFPVRSGFFYETWPGIAVNLLIGGGAMYPPIYRDPSLSRENRASLEAIERWLGRRGTIVGMHPEGTRGKGPDPYELLPAQPGVGQVALRSDATVLPAWINGLSNDVVTQIAANFRRRGEPIVVVFGPPVPLEDLKQQNLRLAIYKRAADRIADHIRALGEQERRLRAVLPAVRSAS